MTREDVSTIVQDVFRDIFDREDIIITDNTTAANLAGWDSLNHVILIGAIEKEFRVRFALGEIAELSDVGAMINLILEKSK
tara:strand:- start:438 stop:680 length:243 start_codon:yes stop_codon:yes gene_type:complete